MANDWIHTRRGATLVEGTLPRLARGLQSLTAELARFNDREEAGLKQEIQAAREESLAELEELRAEIKAYKEGWKFERMRREVEAIADEPDKSWQSEDPRR